MKSHLIIDGFYFALILILMNYLFGLIPGVRHPGWQKGGKHDYSPPF
ncbi:hypothetical protein NRS6085_01355 [Bacillus subtilis]|nr:hypothetical protein NRS6085_04366 [Bacillus subtilis]CAI6223042.1 hypothetical protein NRS6085_01355 [Bacillus subtilis]